MIAAELRRAFVYGELTFMSFYEELVEADIASAVVMFLIGTSKTSAWLITIANLPTQVIAFLSPFMENPQLLVGMIVALALLLGMVLDVTALSLFLMPIVTPLTKTAGIDLNFFGVVFTIAGALGMLTPPVRNVPNVVAGVGKVRLDRIMVGVLLFLFAEIAVLVLLVVFPQIITWPLGFLR